MDSVERIALEGHGSGPASEARTRQPLGCPRRLRRASTVCRGARPKGRRRFRAGRPRRRRPGRRCRACARRGGRPRRRSSASMRAAAPSSVTQSPRDRPSKGRPRTRESAWCQLLGPDPGPVREQNCSQSVRTSPGQLVPAIGPAYPRLALGGDSEDQPRLVKAVGDSLSRHPALRPQRRGDGLARDALGMKGQIDDELRQAPPALEVRPGPDRPVQARGS